MRVLFLADAVIEDILGGSRLVARELACGLIQRGHEVTFLVPRHHPESPVDERHSNGIQVIRYSGAGKSAEFLRAGYVACKRLCAEQSFDIIHTHFAYAAFGPIRAVPSAIPQVRTFHGPWHEEGWVNETGQGQLGPLPRLKAQMRRRLRFEFEAVNLRQSSAVTTLSESFRQYLMRQFRVAGDRIQVIPGGVDSKRFTPAPDKSAARQKLGLPTNKKILLSVRRLVPRMGLDNLIQAMPLILRRHPDTLLLIGGEGPQRQYLEERIEKMGLGGNVQILGRIPEEDLAAYYQAADLFVLPTTALEGFGLVTLEALSSGLPVIGTAVGATPEILKRLDPRLIAAESVPSCLAESVCGLWESRWSDTLTPERLHTFACNHFSWSQHVDQIEQFYFATIDNSQDGRQAPGRLRFQADLGNIIGAVAGLPSPSSRPRSSAGVGYPSGVRLR